MSKHTPGPWLIDDYGSIKAGRETLSVSGVSLPCYKSQEAEANARLIAAAPDLLEALASLMDMRDNCFIPNEGDWWDEQAKAAIAKARGDA